jgi:hypothetical protein
MRKKLLALLMCATMVLGSSAVASAATITQDNITDANKIVNQYTSGAIEKEVDAKETAVTFPVQYTDSTDASKIAFYSYGVVDNGKDADSKNTTTTVKVNKDGAALTQVTSTSVLKGIDDANRVIAFKSSTGTSATKKDNKDGVANPSQTTTNISATAAILSTNSTTYYVESTWQLAGYELKSGEYVVVTADDFDSDWTKNTLVEIQDGKLTTSHAVATLKQYTPAETATSYTFDTVDSIYGVDVDNYINLVDSSKSILKLSKEIIDGYWVKVSKATAAVGSIAQALADNEITSSAAAVDINVYKLEANKDGNPADETGMQKLSKVSLDEKGAAVTFKADWLSRSSAKNANKVYVINPQDPGTIAKYFFKIGSVYEVSDFADDAFTSSYIVSGTYIFDTVEDASQNDGVNDEATTAATTAAPAADTAATSPKTGDVAPIAALAVVMMGACGAMVVASKKRA